MVPKRKRRKRKNQKKINPSDWIKDSDYILSCLNLGLTMEDIRRYRIGTLLSIILRKQSAMEKADREAKYGKVRKATQADIDTQFGKR